MIKGLYSSASALLTELLRQQTIANNLANLNTTGFKQDRVAARNVARQTVPDEPISFTDLLRGATLGPKGDIGTAVLADQPAIDFSPGALRTTGRPLDLALAGPGFFTLETENGRLYTRDGSFGVDANGQIVNSHGDRLLGVDGGPIVVGQGQVTVDADGRVFSDLVPVGQIAVAVFNQPERLRKVGNNLFTSDQPPVATAPGTTIVQQGALEGSNVDATQNMADLLAARRIYEANQRALQIQDDTLDRAVNQVGQVR